MDEDKLCSEINWFFYADLVIARSLFFNFDFDYRKEQWRRWENEILSYLFFFWKRKSFFFLWGSRSVENLLKVVPDSFRFFCLIFAEEPLNTLSNDPSR